MIERLKIALKEDEYRAVVQLAVKDLRSIDDELHYLIRQTLERRGLLKKETENAEAQPQ